MLSREELLNKIHTISHEIINKPRSKCKLLGISQKKGEEALEYQLPSTTKKVMMTEFYEAYKEINKNLFIRHNWYTNQFPNIDKNSPCNFTTIGAVFVRLDIAEYRNKKYYLK